MSSQYGELILMILHQHFGINIKKVAEKLLYGPKTLKLIFHNIDLRLAQVKESLHILIRHSLVCFKSSQNGNSAEYKLEYDNIMKLLRYSKYLELTEKKFGSLGRQLVELFMINGYTDLSHLILTVAKSDNSVNINLSPIKDKVKVLIECSYIIRHCDVNTLNDDQTVPTIFLDPSEKYLMSNIDMKQLYDCLEHQDDNLVTDSVYYKLNFMRFDLDYRNEIILDSIERRFDPEIRLVMSELIDLCDETIVTSWHSTSSPINLSTLKDRIKQKHKRECDSEQYIKVLEDPTCAWIQYSNDSSNSVVVRFEHIIHTLANTLIENIVQTKFGSKAARIFRIIKYKKHVEQNQIQRLAMLPDKEAKKLTYNLLQDNFVMIQELRKPGVTQGPNKSFILFHIDLKLVIEVVLKYCYKAIINSEVRIAHEKLKNKSLIDKYIHVENLKKSVQDQQEESEEILEALNQLMSAKEKEQLAIINKTINMMESSILQVNETLFVLETYKSFMNLKIK